MDWKEIRKQFPALARWTYMNNATYGQLPLRSQAAMAAHLARRDEFACRDFLEWFDDLDEIRGLVGRFIGCEASDVAFVSTAAEALSLFLGGIDWRPGDKIATMPDEFPNQFYYAKRLASRGVETVEVPHLAELPEGTRAVVVSSASYINGYRPDLVRISRMAHDMGALVYIDGTQTVGALRFDVGEVAPDLFAVNAYKWGISPNGAAYMYVSPELRTQLEPATVGWRTDKDWRLVDQLNTGAPVLSDRADRYEGGMVNFPSLYAMGESIRMFLEIGTDVVEARVLELAGKTASALEGLGASIVNRNTNIVAARFGDLDASILSKRLVESRVIVSARHGNLRVAPHFYNDESDIEALVHGIRAVRGS
jgi:selenocysteine lyase/cysteine desulfurase